MEFVSGGAKQYGLKLQRKGAICNNTDDFEYVLKLRGITLNYDIIQNQGLRYETFKESVLHFARSGKVEPIQVIYPNFLRPSINNGSITSAPLRKIYKPYVGKGIVCSRDFSVLNFGHISP